MALMPCGGVQEVVIVIDSDSCSKDIDAESSPQ